jgi:iron complex outermembrane receptor protein
MRGSIRKAGDSRAPDYVITNSGFEEQDWAVATGYLKERFGIEVNYSHFGTELGIFGGSHIGNLSDLERAIERGQPVVKNDFTYDIGFPKQTVSHDLLSLKTSYKFARAGRLEMQYGWQENRRKEYDAHAPFSSQPPSRAAFDLKLITHTGEVRFQHHPVKSIFGKIGVSGMRQTNVRKTTGFLIPNFRADTIGAYFVENWSTGRLTVSTGTRLSYRWQKVFEAGSRNIPERVHEWSNVSGVAGLIYQFAGDWSIATNIGTAWRPPGVNELYSNGVHHGTAQMEIGDPDLTTEKSFNVDATLRNIGGRSHLEFSVYRNRIDDFMLLFPEPEPTLTIRGAFPTFSYRQTDALLRGFDLTFDYRLTGLYRFGLRGSLVRGDDLGADEPLIYMPSDRLTWLNGFDLPSACLLHDLSFELSTLLVRRQTRFPEGADYADPPPGYTLFDLDLRGKLDFGRSHVSLNLSVKNLFNVAYRDYLSRFRYFIDEPGRTILFKTQIPIGHFSL